MTTYIVSSESSLSPLNVKFNNHTRETAIKMLKEAQKAFRAIVEGFAAKHPGQVTVGDEDAWINGTLKVETTPALAEKLRKVKGIGDVSEPMRIVCESKPHQPKP